MDDKKKNARYERLYEQIEDLMKKSDSSLSHMATICAVLHNKMDYFFWTGFYLLQDGKLQVGPYQGPLACQELEKEKGVCWAACNTKTSIIVPDVSLYPGHIACDNRSKSEIAVPLFSEENKVVAVLDVDSQSLESFNNVDQEWLSKIITLI